MKAFKDKNGRDWLVSVTVDTIKRVRDLVKVDLLGFATGEVAQALAADPILQVDVLYVVCKPQADKDGVTDVQFGQAMDGDVIDAGMTALIEETISFFPNRRQGLIRDLRAKGLEVGEAATRLAAAKIAGLDPEAIARTLTNSAGISPASSASTPAPSPSES